jgi:hypothetical protein
MRKVPESGTVAVHTSMSAAKTTAIITNARTREGENTAWANGRARATINNSWAIAEVCNPDSEEPSMRAISRANNQGTTSPALIEEIAAPNKRRLVRSAACGSCPEGSRTVVDATGSDVPVVGVLAGDVTLVDVMLGDFMVEPR